MARYASINDAVVFYYITYAVSGISLPICAPVICAEIHSPVGQALIKRGLRCVAGHTEIYDSTVESKVAWIV